MWGVGRVVWCGGCGVVGYGVWGVGCGVWDAGCGVQGAVEPDRRVSAAPAGDRSPSFLGSGCVGGAAELERAAGGGERVLHQSSSPPRERR